MMIETSRLPTHLALVARRINIVSPDDLAARFLETSYLAEAFLKTVAVVLHGGLKKSAREIAYRHAYELVRADGLGSWEQTIRGITTQPTAGYLPHEFFPLLAWISKKRTKPEDDWYQAAIADARRVLGLLGTDLHEAGKGNTVKDLITCLVQIRNKTKAHGAVGEDFYSAVNAPYLRTVVSLMTSSPVVDWQWLHLLRRESGKLRSISLVGTDPKHIVSSEASQFAVDGEGVHFVPYQSSRAFFCGELIKSSRECTVFSFPNGGLNSSGICEFIDYGSGKTSKEQADSFIAPPVPLPPSETEGLSTIDIQSNTFGNLPELPAGYITRKSIDAELTSHLLDKNHQVITLHGGGGMGKTSLALATAHNLAAHRDPPFEHIVWFSARDIDLRPTGPSEVRPRVIDLKTVSKHFGHLFSVWGGGESPEALAKALQSPDAVSSKGILFVFDNFETMADVSGLLKFLDQHTHLPNKALITSRERTPLSGYPIEVKGMEPDEAQQMLLKAAEGLGIGPLLTPTVVNRIYDYTGGHAYVMRVVLGEMAKDGRYSPPNTVMGRRQDIVDAVFERSFNKLSEAGRNVFLLVANWKANVPEVGLIVVLGIRGLSAMSGLEECRAFSLVYTAELPGNQMFYSVPTLARGFAHKKLHGDPDRLVIQQDLSTLQRFGVSSVGTSGEDAEKRLISQFVSSCFSEIGKGSEEVGRADRLLEGLANTWPPGWLHLAEFRSRCGTASDSIGYALRRAVEEEPFSKSAWLSRARFALETQDEGLHITSLVSAVDADPHDADLVKDVAFQLCQYVNRHKHELPKARRGVYLASVRSHMQRLAEKLDATALSRLAWLFLLEENTAKAKEYATKGCVIEPTNRHCIKILERLERKADDTLDE